MDEPRNQSEEPLPGSVSGQNAEEAEPGHDGGSEHRSHNADDEHEGDSSGESGEGSQSTGNPDSAG